MANNEGEGTRAVIDSMGAKYESVFGESNCPQWVKDSIGRYVEHGIPTGDFLRAVLANDMMGSFLRADIATAQVMASIVAHVERHVPSVMRGDYRTVDDYIVFRRNERRAHVADQVEAAEGK